jgi:hypothetical protein
LLFGDGVVYSIGGYEVQDNLSKKATDKAYYLNLKTKQWYYYYIIIKRRPCSRMPISLVGSTALFSKEQKRIFILGGVSNEIDLTSQKLIFVIYDVAKDSWEFTTDLSFNSPFRNSRFMKPIVDLINDHYFISFEKLEDSYLIEIFELVKGGVNLKFSIEN